MIKANQKAKSNLIVALMDKANQEFDKLSAVASRSRIIGGTVKAILPILRDHVKMVNKFMEEKKCEKDSNK